MADKADGAGVWDGNLDTLPAAQLGPWKLPLPGALPPLENKVDYEALRQKRMAEVDEETRLINLPFPQQPQGAPPPPMHELAPDLEARNVEVPGPAGPLQMRLYMPKQRKEPVGLYFHTHGGGWCLFDGLENCDTENSMYAKDFGCAVAQVDFRVSWKAKFPAAVEDCFAAYKWVVENADELGVDRTRIGIGGGCTGANLATVVALMARDAGIQKPAVQWLWTPVFDTRNNTQTYEEFANYSLTQAQAEAVTRLYLRSKEDTFDWRASPILAETFEGMSPAIIWAGEWEVLREESRAYAARAKEAGVDVTYIEGPQQPHAGIYARNPMTQKPTAYAAKARPEIHQLIRNYIGPRT
ncbi:MAG TPA: alpha/beta hydrolase [Terricaulis sp.]|nr:alpha/beta hydrolase [Terricaulis sp.]